MKDKWGSLLDAVVFITLLCAVFFAVMLGLGVLILALIVKPIQLLYKAMVFITNRSWNWIRSPLSS